MSNLTILLVGMSIPLAVLSVFAAYKVVSWAKEALDSILEALKEANSVNLASIKAIDDLKAHLRTPTELKLNDKGLREDIRGLSLALSAVANGPEVVSGRVDVDNFAVTSATDVNDLFSNYRDELIKQGWNRESATERAAEVAQGAMWKAISTGGSEFGE